MPIDISNFTFTRKTPIGDAEIILTGQGKYSMAVFFKRAFINGVQYVATAYLCEVDGDIESATDQNELSIKRCKFKIGAVQVSEAAKNKVMKYACDAAKEQLAVIAVIRESDSSVLEAARVAALLSEITNLQKTVVDSIKHLFVTVERIGSRVREIEHEVEKMKGGIS